MAVKTARRSGTTARSRQEPAGENGTLADRAYRKLEEEIVTLRLAPGTMVSEAVLSRRLGIGRMPIREALQRLSRERLVVIMPKRGIVVAEVNVGSQLRLLEARREIERLLSRLAARRATAEQRARFDQIAAGMDKAGAEDDDATFIGLDREYNILVMEAARNEYAAGAMTLMHGLSRRFWYIHYKQVADLPLTARLHADIARAIAAADQDGAAAASDRLLDYIETFTRATLADG
ncbi:MAG TPA: GntR family transcriptional regulator [Alphaproteobacteria bacterium]|jgi:DNA-binding GntR family transcriptional regulator|nr:GntR family transcriptional regulator [Alphaproteobacteria bacterium]